MMRDFGAEVATLEVELTRDRARAVGGLRSVRERWARATLGLGDDEDLVRGIRRLVEGGLDGTRAGEAAAHLADAERWQWEIGTWSTGAGEGLASMFSVRSLQLARAWLESVRVGGEPAVVAEVRRLVCEVRDDPNDVAARLRGHVEALLVRLPGGP